MTDETRQEDPFALWRQWYEQNQAAWGKGVADATGTEAFAEMQGKMLESLVAFQKTMRDMSRAQLESLGLPTRDDIARLGEIVLGLEEKIDSLGDRLARMEKSRAMRAPATATRAPARAKRKPAKRK
jgi:polyhydroxyalkanoic acid synthase PhaR subunit